MRKIFAFIVILFVVSGCSSSTDNQSNRLPADGHRNIVLMHPTVRNLKTFIFLTENGIFPLPKDYGVIGVYHSKGSYDYSQSLDFVKNEGLKNIALIEVKPELNPSTLYGENECTLQFTEIFEKSEGAIFFGGPDIPPACYGETTSMLTVIEDVHRHYLEISMLFHLLGGSQDTMFQAFLNQKPDYRILGICLGMQSMNVATGGTMIQDIPAEVYGINTIEEVLALDENQRHRNYNTNFGTDNDLIWGHMHQVQFEKGNLLDSLNGFANSLPFIWSSHHQCADKLGRNLVPAAWSYDGKIVEAVTHKKFPNVIGLQFHPEATSIYKPEDKLSVTPFQEDKKSYIDLYSGKRGEDFHRTFWKFFGELFQ